MTGRAAGSSVMRRCAGLVPALLVAALGPAAAAAGLDAHVHGESEMNIAIEGGTVMIELISPGADIVGFEHAPATADERAAIEKAAHDLGQGSALFRFPEAAGCALEDAEVIAPGLDDDHGGDSHGHAPQDGHAEFRGRYTFACTDPAALGHVDLGLFERFPAMAAIEVQAITPRGQRAARLTPETSRLGF